jgi:hypothetical protein
MIAPVARLVATLMQGSDARLNMLLIPLLQVMQPKNLYIARARKNRKKNLGIFDLFWLLARFGECQVTARLVAARLHSFPLVREDFRVCHPSLARSDFAAATPNHQNWPRAFIFLGLINRRLPCIHCNDLEPQGISLAAEGCIRLATGVASHSDRGN